MMQAKQTDALSLLLWSKTKDAEEGKNAPKSLVAALTGEDQEGKDQGKEAVLFDTEEEFDDYWRQHGGG